MFRKLDLLISKIERFVIGLSLISMTALIFSNIALRFFTGQTITWAEDLSIFLMICMSFFGAAYGTRLNRHITMSAIYDVMSRRNKRIFYLAGLILSACLSGFLFIMGVQVTRTIYAVKGEIPSMGLPKFWPYFVVTVALLFMAIHFIQLMLRFLTTREVDDVLELEE